MSCPSPRDSRAYLLQHISSSKESREKRHYLSLDHGVTGDACNVICVRSLFSDSEQSPAVYLRDDPLFGSLQLQQHSELRAPTAERAAFYLDAAVAGRQREDGDAHMLYTLHVYQYSVAGKGGGKPDGFPSTDFLFFASRRS